MATSQRKPRNVTTIALPGLVDPHDLSADRQMADFFGFAANPVQLQAIACGPLMTRYSKDTSYDYSTQLRRDLIADATAHYRPEIDRALAMLRAAAEKSPLLARAVARAED